MTSKKIKPPVTYNIEKEHFLEIQRLKKVKDRDEQSAFSRLDNTEIYLLAISLAVQNKLKPKKSNKSNTFVRTEQFDRDESSQSFLKSLIYNFTKRVDILLPEKYNEFYETAESLANSGMVKFFELIKRDKREIEKLVLSISEDI